MIIVDYPTYYDAQHGKRLDLSWQDITERFQRPKIQTIIAPLPDGISEEEAKEWKAAVDKIKKDCGYVFYGDTKGGRKRNVDIINHSALALDYDGLTDGEHWLESVRKKLSCNYMYYSTTKSTAEKLRIRLIIPLSRPVVGDEYQALGRAMIADLGFDGIDSTTLDDSRAMGYTALLSGQTYLYHAVTDKEALDVDKFLNNHYTDWKNVSEWPKFPGEDELVKKTKNRAKANKSGDEFVEPTDIKGYVGAFCRRYGISRTIKEFLPDVYTEAGQNRWTYKDGSSTGGLLVFDDRACISYHSTDPLADGKVHNAFGLLMTHLYNGNRKQAMALIKRNADVIAEYRHLVAVVEIPECASNWGDLAEYPANDWGIARRLNDMYHDKIGWATDAKTWLMYDGVRWSDCDKAILYNLFPRIAEVMSSISAHIKSADDVQAIANIVYMTQSSKSRDSILKALMPMVALVRGDMDNDDWGMNTTHGYLNLRGDSDYVTDNSPVQHCCKRAGAGFDTDFVQDDECINFLKGVLPDPNVRFWMQKFMGYCLTGSMREKLAVFLHAPANNGKTTFINLVKAAFGDYVETGDESLICTNRYGNNDGNSPTPGIASLAGARICLYDEITTGRKIDSAAFKRMTGSSPMKARKLRQDPFQFNPKFKMIIACNDIPAMQDANDPAMKIRIRVVPFTATFNAKNADKTIEEKITTESWRNTFLYWCFEGLQYYIADGLDNYGVGINVDDSNLPELMKTAFHDYVKDTDELGDFFETYFTITHNDNDFVSFEQIYSDYITHVSSQLSKKMVSVAVRRFMVANNIKEGRKYVKTYTSASQQRGYFGIKYME